MKPPAWLTWLSGTGARGAVLRIAAIGAWTVTTVREAKDVVKITANVGRISEDEMFLVDAIDCPDEALPVLAGRIAELEKGGGRGIVAVRATPSAAIATREGEAPAQIFRSEKDTGELAFVGGPGPDLPRALILPTLADLPENVWLLGFEFVSAEAVALGPAPALVIVVGRRSDSAAVAADVESLRARWPGAVVVAALR